VKAIIFAQGLLTLSGQKSVEIILAGKDQLGYRYIQENPEELTSRFLKKIRILIVLVGSINSFVRIDKVKELNPWVSQ